jgi:hypothetical protein
MSKAPAAITPEAALLAFLHDPSAAALKGLADEILERLDSRMEQLLETKATQDAALAEAARKLNMREAAVTEREREAEAALKRASDAMANVEFRSADLRNRYP